MFTVLFYSLKCLISYKHVWYWEILHLCATCHFREHTLVWCDQHKKQFVVGTLKTVFENCPNKYCFVDMNATMIVFIPTRLYIQHMYLSRWREWQGMTGELSKPHPLSQRHRWLLKLVIICWQRSMCYSVTVSAGRDRNKRNEWHLNHNDRF